MLVERRRHASSMWGLPPASDLAGAVVVVAPTLLRLFGRLWIGTHFHSHLAAFLLVQHALRYGAAARLCPVYGLPGSGTALSSAQGAPLRVAGKFAIGGSEQRGA